MSCINGYLFNLFSSLPTGIGKWIENKTKFLFNMRDGNGGGCMQARMIYLDPYFKGEDLFTLWSHKVVNLLLVDSIAEGKPSTNNLFL